MTRAIKLGDLVPLDETAIQILRVLSLHMGEKDEAYVDYKLIGDSLDLDRDTVRKAVNRMIAKKVLSKRNGKLAIEKAIVVN